MRKHRVDEALEMAARRLGATLLGERRYGWFWKSAGQRVACEDGGHAWLRVHYRKKGQETPRTWDGLLQAQALAGVPRPEVRRHVDWSDGERFWRAIVMTHVEADVCHPQPHIPPDAPLPPKFWFEQLRHALERLRIQPTARIAVTQREITRRLRRRLGADIDAHIASWGTVHSDLHWANLTQPELTILDWEAWGRGPADFDPSLLLAFSVRSPEAVELIRTYFADWLTTHDGRISQLLACDHVLSIAETNPDYRDVKAPVERLAADVLNEHQNA